MPFPEVIHLGGENGVTGSCHLLRANGLNILVDCGTVQGRDWAAPMERWPVRPSEIPFLFLTHAHIDHAGRVPELVHKGFKGEIIATAPTVALLGPVLKDARGWTGAEEEKKREARRKHSGDDGRSAEAGESVPVRVPASTIEIVEELAWGFEYGEVFDLKNGVRFSLGNAGHILGSCFIRFADEREGWSVCFSGDLGARGTPILPDPEPPEGCDILVLESTYGDTDHGDRSLRAERLGKILSQALEDGGKVFIPAFALGRTQELIYEMDRVFSAGSLQGERIPVYVDTPLGLELTSLYSGLSPYWDQEAKTLLARGDDPLDFARLYGVKGHRAHEELLAMPGPAVIIAGSGMCTGGRILDHLKAGLGDPRNDVLFVGYQAAGTLGREILRCAQAGRGRVPVDGERVEVRARVQRLPGYSAHADRQGLVDWVRSARGRIGAIKLVHGEAGAKRALAESIAHSA